MFKYIDNSDFLRRIIDMFPFYCDEMKNIDSRELLSPDRLAQEISSAGFSVKWEVLPVIPYKEAGAFYIEGINNSILYDGSFTDIQIEKTLNSLFPKELNLKGEVIVLTDDMRYFTQKAITLNYDNLYYFIDVIYPELFNKDFFQPEDQIFLFSEMEILILFQHEGIFAHIIKNG